MPFSRGRLFEARLSRQYQCPDLDVSILPAAAAAPSPPFHTHKVDGHMGRVRLQRRRSALPAGRVTRRLRRRHVGHAQGEREGGGGAGWRGRARCMQWGCSGAEWQGWARAAVGGAWHAQCSIQVPPSPLPLPASVTPTTRTRLLPVYCGCCDCGPPAASSSFNPQCLNMDRNDDVRSYSIRRIGVHLRLVPPPLLPRFPPPPLLPVAGPFLGGGAAGSHAQPGEALEERT